MSFVPSVHLKVPVPKSVKNNFFVKLADMVTFPTNISFMVFKIANLFWSGCKQLEKTMFMLLIGL